MTSPHDASPVCPGCGTGADLHMYRPVEPGSAALALLRPAPGEMSVCFACGVPSVMTDERVLRPLTAEEHSNLLADPGVRRTLTLVGRFAAARRPSPSVSW